MILFIGQATASKTRYYLKGNIMIFFNTRKQVREFSKKTGKKLIDLGSDAPKGKRWAISVLKGK